MLHKRMVLNVTSYTPRSAPAKGAPPELAADLLRERDLPRDMQHISLLMNVASYDATINACNDPSWGIILPNAE